MINTLWVNYQSCELGPPAATGICYVREIESALLKRVACLLDLGWILSGTLLVEMKHTSILKSSIDFTFNSQRKHISGLTTFIETPIVHSILLNVDIKRAVLQRQL